MMTAQALAVVFNDLFGGVIYAGLDTDKEKGSNCKVMNLFKLLARKSV